MALCRALQAQGVKISFDPNVRKELASATRAILTSVRELMAMSSIFLPSEEDAETLFPGRSLSELCARSFLRGGSTMSF